MSHFARRLHRIGLALALGLAANSVSAQAAEVVTDPTSYFHMAEQLKQMEDLWKTAQDQLSMARNQLEQLVSTIQGLSKLSPGLGNANLLPLTDDQRSQLIQMNCKNDSGGLISNVVDALFSSDASIDVQQRNVCMQIVSIQVDKYNLTVAMLHTVQQHQNNFFSEITSIIDNVKSIADSGRINAQAQSYSNVLTTDMANWRAQMDAKDALIRTLQTQQGVLGRAALNGSGVVSDAVSTGVLIGVLQGLKK